MPSSADCFGLELLEDLAQVDVKQIMTWCSGRKYEVTSPEEEVLFHLADSCTWTCLLGGGRRPFHVHALDVQNTPGFNARRPYHIFADKVEVSIDEKVVSLIRKEPAVKPIYSINDADDKPFLRAKGNFTAGVFKLQSMDKEFIGSIANSARPLSCSRHYKIYFPKDLDIVYKVAVIATCIFIDYRYH